MNIKKQNVVVLVAGILMCASGCAAAALPDVNNVVKSFEIAGNSTTSKIIETAKQTAVAALTLQWIISYWKDLFGNEIKDTLIKAAGMITWFGISIALISNIDILSTIFKNYVTFAGTLANVDAATFTPTGIIRKGSELMMSVHIGYLKSLGRNFSIMDFNIIAVITLTIIDIILIICFFLLSLSLFVAHVEFWLMFSIAPLAFALAPLQSMRDQAIAPGKGVIAFGFRIIMLGLIISVANTLTNDLISAFENGIPGDPEASILGKMMEYLCGLLGCALMALNAGKIAASIASGSASLSGGDAMRAGVAVAGGVAAAAGGAVAVGAVAANAAKSISIPPTTPSRGAGAAFGVSPSARADDSGIARVPGAGAPVKTDIGGPAIQNPPPISSLRDTPKPPSTGGSGTSAAPSTNVPGNPNVPTDGGDRSMPPPSGPGDTLSQPIGSGPGATPERIEPRGAAGDTSVPPADVSGAGIGGPMGNGYKPQSAFEKAAARGSRAIDHASHDAGNISVHVNLGADK